MARFTAYVRTDMHGSRCEAPFDVPDDELDGLSDGERADVIATYAHDAIESSYEWGWTEDEG